MCKQGNGPALTLIDNQGNVQIEQGMAKQTTVPPSSETLLLREIEERKHAERELQQKAHDLGERLKELNCLYTVSALLQESGLSLDEVVRRTVRSLAVAYQYPDITCARAVIEGGEYYTDNFRETPWKQIADIVVNGTRLGGLEVYYLEERPSQAEGPFLKEERDLLNTVAVFLGRSIKEWRERDALVRSEARFRRVVELVPDILYQVTLPTYRAVFISPAIETLLGFTPDEWLAGEDSWQRQLHEDDRARVLAEVDALIGRADVFSVEYRVWDKDGETLHWFADRLSVERDAHGTPISAFGIMSDITDRKVAEEALRRREQEFRTLAENSPDIIGRFSKELRHVYVNHAIEVATGLPRATFVGKTMWEMGFPERTALFCEEQLRSVFQTGEKKKASFVYESPCGVRHYEWHMAPERGADNQVESVLVTARDITERVRMQEALRQREAELRDAQRVAHVGSWEWEAGTDTVTWSEEFYRIAGRDPQLPAPDYYTDHARLYTAESLARLRPAVERALRTGEPYELDLELLRPDGTTRWIVGRGEARRDASGQIVGLHGTALDITERKRMEEMLRTLNAELERRVVERTAQLEAAARELEGVSYTVSHDLRAPVRAVDGFAGILLEDYRHALNAEGMRLLQVIRDNTKKMGWMIDAILDFLRLGRMEMGMTGIDMDELARAVVQELEPMVRGRAVRIEIRPMPPAHGDRAMIHRVMANLVANALKFTRPKKTARIEIGGETGEKENIFYVKDNGVGFDMQYAGKLFGIFQRLHGMDEFEGTGIGLAIVHRIVTRHGGRVWAEGKVGAGATFYFALPATLVSDSGA